jgi:hypothetical protein
MKLLLMLIAGFVCIGVFFRKYDARTRWLVFLVAASAVAYATLK